MDEGGSPALSKVRPSICVAETGTLKAGLTTGTPVGVLADAGLVAATGTTLFLEEGAGAGNFGAGLPVLAASLITPRTAASTKSDPAAAAVAELKVLGLPRPGSPWRRGSSAWLVAVGT